MRFWQTYWLLHTQATYPFRRIKKAYKVLVRKVLSAKDVLIDQKDISRIAILVKLIVFSIEYSQKLNTRITNITYGIVTIIKKTRNYKNSSSAINAYYQALRKLRELNKTDTASETVSVTESNKKTFTLDCTWYNIKNLWKEKKKAKLEELKESEKCYYILSPLLLIEDLFKEVLLKPVFDPFELGEGLLEFEKRKDEEMISKDLAHYLSKNLWTLLETRE